MTTNELESPDPAAIMAEHQGHDTGTLDYGEHCLPYRLAAESAALREDRDAWREKAMAENAILIERTAQRDELRTAVQRVRDRVRQLSIDVLNVAYVEDSETWAIQKSVAQMWARNITAALQGVPNE